MRSANQRARTKPHQPTSTLPRSHISQCQKVQHAQRRPLPAGTTQTGNFFERKLMQASSTSTTPLLATSTPSVRSSGAEKNLSPSVTTTGHSPLLFEQSERPLALEPVSFFHILCTHPLPLNSPVDAVRTAFAAASTTDKVDNGNDDDADDTDDTADDDDEPPAIMVTTNKKTTTPLPLPLPPRRVGWMRSPQP